VLELVFNEPFPKVRPDWLKNPKTGRNLELDCYNSKLQIALEYNGEQHYNPKAAYSKGEEWFKEQQERDKFKQQKCKELNIHLIIVPHTVKKKDLYKYIIDRLPPATS